MPKITRDIIESYIACHYKAHLTFLGLHQTSAGDASLLEDGVVGHQRTSERFIQSAELNKHSDNSIKLTSDYLRQGQPAISNGVYETDTLSLYFDGLQRVPGSSDIGDFHYLPLIFDDGTQTQKSYKLLLDLYGLVLFRLQGRIPNRGIIQRDNARSSRVLLSRGLDRGEHLLKAVMALHRAKFATRPDLE